KTSRNKIKVRRNEIQIRRNEIQISLPSMNLAFSMVYLRFRPGGPAKPARRPFATVRTDSELQLTRLSRKCRYLRKAARGDPGPLAAVYDNNLLMEPSPHYQHSMLRERIIEHVFV